MSFGAAAGSGHCGAVPAVQARRAEQLLAAPRTSFVCAGPWEGLPSCTERCAPGATSQGKEQGLGWLAYQPQGFQCIARIDAPAHRPKQVHCVSAGAGKGKHAQGTSRYPFLPPTAEKQHKMRKYTTLLSLGPCKQDQKEKNS